MHSRNSWNGMVQCMSLTWKAIADYSIPLHQRMLFLIVSIADPTGSDQMRTGERMHISFTPSSFKTFTFHHIIQVTKRNRLKIPLPTSLSWFSSLRFGLVRFSCNRITFIAHWFERNRGDKNGSISISQICIMFFIVLLPIVLHQWQKRALHRTTRYFHHNDLLSLR